MSHDAVEVISAKRDRQELSDSQIDWVVDAYTLPLAGLLLTAATLGDRIGRRRMYLVGMAIFTAGFLVLVIGGILALKFLA